MSFIEITFNRKVDTDELKEILVLAEAQETTDKETNTEIHIEGDYATIDVSIDEDGNIIVL